MKSNDIIEFTRTKPFKLIEEIGSGAFGRTVLLRDEIIDESFVCKKYSPLSHEWKEDYFKNFKNEIKLLHLLYHKNIVRVFNYYLYPESYLGYILMEYIDGTDIISYIKEYPENINNIFYQVIDGFKYLEEHEILHRDIRPYNIMVTNNGIVKIIDFGFGKKIHFEQDFDKSITLNWWCDIPNDFSENKYDFQTEIYFIGKLFEQVILEQEIKEFKYKDLLNHMISINSLDRIDSFNSCYKTILNQQYGEISFKDYEIHVYRSFSNTLSNAISKIEHSNKFINDTDQIIKNLEDIYKKTMLEEYLPESSMLIKCFLQNKFYYIKDYLVPVNMIYEFIQLLKSCSQEKRNIIINNLETKLEVVEKYDEIIDVDIPF